MKAFFQLSSAFDHRAVVAVTAVVISSSQHVHANIGFTRCAFVESLSTSGDCRPIVAPPSLFCSTSNFFTPPLLPPFHYHTSNIPFVSFRHQHQNFHSSSSTSFSIHFSIPPLQPSFYPATQHLLYFTTTITTSYPPPQLHTHPHPSTPITTTPRQLLNGAPAEACCKTTQCNKV